MDNMLERHAGDVSIHAIGIYKHQHVNPFSYLYRPIESNSHHHMLLLAILYDNRPIVHRAHMHMSNVCLAHICVTVRSSIIHAHSQWIRFAMALVKAINESIDRNETQTSCESARALYIRKHMTTVFSCWFLHFSGDFSIPYYIAEVPICLS